ncbi:MAG: acetylornithine deacetylase [Pseudomonadales bacterium]|nr:acetylornithine deacetylase [Pseudomonadales bacterium]
MLPKFDDMLTTLVSEPSISSTTPDIDRSNLRVIEHLANWLDGIGFNTELMPLPDNPKKANLIASYGPSLDEGGGLVLAGHTDTVPYDESKWQTDPFTVTERDDKLFGLGSCDMKGFFPVALEAASTFLNHDLKAPITIVATSDEESSMAGARYLASKEQPKADYAIIGEPTGLRPVYAHKGIAFMSVKLQGESGHSSNPDLGCNALDAMHDVMGELIQFRQELATQNQNPAFDVNVPTLNLGCLHAGDSPNRICSHAELQIDLRLLPGMDTDATIEMLRYRLQQAIAHCDIKLELDTQYPPIPPFESDIDSDLVQTLAKYSGNMPGTVAFGTEGHFLKSLGMETVVFGPGSIDQAHQPNEYLARDQIAPAAETLRHVIQRYCVG